MKMIFHDKLQDKLEKYYKYGSFRTRIFHRLRVEYINSLFKKYKVKNSKVLDVGCSAGIYSVLAARENTEVTGIDPDKVTLARLKDWLKEEKLKNTTAVLGAAEKLPFSNGYFDFIVCSEVLEHVQDIKKSVEEMYRVLKPGGLIFLSMPNKFGFDYVFLAKYLKKHEKDEDPHTQFSPKRIKSLFPNFEIVEEAGNGILPVPWRYLPRITMHKPISVIYYQADKLLGKTPLKFLGTNYFLVLRNPTGS